MLGPPVSVSWPAPPTMVVAVGVDDVAIYATVHDLHRLLVAATLLALCVVVLVTVLVARKTTEPIRLLKEQTERIAAGDLDAMTDLHASAAYRRRVAVTLSLRALEQARDNASAKPAKGV